MARYGAISRPMQQRGHAVLNMVAGAKVEQVGCARFGQLSGFAEVGLPEHGARPADLRAAKLNLRLAAETDPQGVPGGSDHRLRRLVTIEDAKVPQSTRQKRSRVTKNNHVISESRASDNLH